ncbi:MAG: hypothetical protein PHD97_12340 [Bacteroidales bacterium]|nr:hypothetical protein [Bacteroidales bacterium]
MNYIYTFDKEKHHHFINGIRVPGVTGILKAEGFIDTEFMGNPEALYRGNYVHLACHYYNIGKLAFDSLNDEFKGYIEGYMLFCQVEGIKDPLSELPAWSGLWMYAGIIDVLLEERLFDIKTSKQKSKWWKYQTAGYKALYEEMQGKKSIKERASVQLFSDGTYKIDEHKDKNDERNFMNILTVHKLKIRDGIIPQGE